MTFPAIPLGGATRRQTSGIQRIPAWSVGLAAVAGLGLGLAALGNDRPPALGAAAPTCGSKCTSTS